MANSRSPMPQYGWHAKDLEAGVDADILLCPTLPLMNDTRTAWSGEVSVERGFLGELRQEGDAPVAAACNYSS